MMKPRFVLTNVSLMVTSVVGAIGLISTLSSSTLASPTSEMLSNHGNHLRRLTKQNSLDTQGDGPFADGTETLYYDFSLAWRFLGFYTDCNVCVKEADGEDEGNDDANDDEYEKLVAPSECLENGEDRTVCRRYALWAAYVDESYEGKGPSEYQHFDHRTKRWDQSACGSTEGRCAKLDCHDPSSQNFKLVGVFKDHRTDAFIDNLIDYQGDCVWNDEEYKFMKAMRSNKNNDDKNGNNHSLLPTKCTAYEIEGRGGKIYSGYYDALPTQKGNLGVALYTDASCTILYEGKDHSAQEVMARSLGTSSSNMDGKIKLWNEAMDALKICQPCVAYNTITNDPKKPYNENGDRYDQKDANDEEEEEENDDDDDDAFVCRNNLDRDEPVNQCEVFTEQGKNSMTFASYDDILLAESQGTVTGIDLSPYGKPRGKMAMGKRFVEPDHTWLSILLLLISMGFFGYALAQLFQKDRSKHGSNAKDLNKPLVSGDNEKNKERKEESKKKSQTRSNMEE
mmetsp:Transcript_30574/g.72119  ORF Transcript_30574/g.72119 Transcript_30574/m.72119 type:complete len:510 (+) Transcript_30574:79-1608(+)